MCTNTESEDNDDPNFGDLNTKDLDTKNIGLQTQDGDNIDTGDTGEKSMRGVMDLE